MKGIILAAGLGKRLKPFTQDIPKSMLRVGNRPIIEYTIRLLRKFGIKDIIINLHCKPQAITDYLEDGKNFGVRINYSYERVLLGTAGAVKKVQALLKETFLVAYGDTLRNINIADMLNRHKKKKADVTIALYRVKNPRGCGIAKMGLDNAIYKFIEKPKQIANMGNGYANCGLYIIEPRVLRDIPQRRKCDFARDVFPRLIKERCPIYGYPTDSYLLDIGTPQSYAKAKKIYRIFKDL